MVGGSARAEQMSDPARRSSPNGACRVGLMKDPADFRQGMRSAVVHAGRRLRPVPRARQRSDPLPATSWVLANRDSWESPSDGKYCVDTTRTLDSAPPSYNETALS